MELLSTCKTQLMSLIILLYIGILYIRDGNSLNKISGGNFCNKIFDALLIVADIALIFDGITAFTVNITHKVPNELNMLFHMCMLVSYEVFMTLLFWYWVTQTVGKPKKPYVSVLYTLPCVIAVCLTIHFLPQIKYIAGIYTNYSMGISIYICFATIIFYLLMTVGVIVYRHTYIQKKKKIALATTLIFVILILAIQIIWPESLVSGIAATMIVLSIYLTMENPSIHSLVYYQQEMVMGFATLVENKDDSTGGHIRRSSEYALMIARNLKRKKKYKKIINRDYVTNLSQAAPMHDVGKIGIPYVILQKPGKLTDEEYAIMKRHAEIGGKIISETFGHLLDAEYEDMAYNVARHHHEKYNGKGYPDGLAGEEIPLSARIMAVADVFDAVSAKRCYRDAMPLKKCYEIILNGRGTDFDPDVVDAFMEDKSKIERIYAESI